MTGNLDPRYPGTLSGPLQMTGVKSDRVISGRHVLPRSRMRALRSRFNSTLRGLSFCRVLPAIASERTASSSGPPFLCLLP